MGAIFGKSKKTAPSRITEQDKAVLVNAIVVGPLLAIICHHDVGSFRFHFHLRSN